MWYGDEVSWRGRPEPAAPGLASLFPGELALRDATAGSTRLAQLCAARFAVLQLVERYLAGGVDPARWPLELDAPADYLDAIDEFAREEALALKRVLDRIARDEARGAAAPLLAAGDISLACGQPFAAWGFFRASFDLTKRGKQGAVALSAASRLSELAARLDEPVLARRWAARCGRLLAGCR